MKHSDDDPPGDGPPEEIPQILLPTEEEAQALLEHQVGEEDLLPAIPKADLSGVLVVFPLRRSVPFPGLVMPVQAEAGNETGIMEQALAQGRHVGLLLAEGGDAATLPRPREFRRVGVVAEVHKRIRRPGTRIALVDDGGFVGGNVKAFDDIHRAFINLGVGDIAFVR